MTGVQTCALPILPVNVEVLKPEDIQQAYGPPYELALTGRRSEDGSVDLLHDPHKQPSIDPLEKVRLKRSKVDLF